MPVEIGKINTLRVVKIVEFGAYLDGGDRGEILLPKNTMPDNCAVGSSIEVFVYFDSESRIIDHHQEAVRYGWRSGLI